MCDDRCGMQISLLDGKISAVAGIPGHPWNDGKLCAKGKAVKELVYAPDRIDEPLKRVGQSWRAIGLETAYNEIAERMSDIIKKNGARSIGIWKGEGVGFQQQEGLARRFAHAIGTPNYFSSDSACFSSRYIGFALVYGNMLIPDFENSACITIWGANPINTHPFAFEKIVNAKRAGAKVIVIDPRQSETAKLADIHAPIRPGTDGALAWGIIRCLIESDQLDYQFVNEYTFGYEETKTYALGLSRELISADTGLNWEIVRIIAEHIAQAGSRMATFVGNGLELHDNGAENTRAIAIIPALLGCVDTPGGSRLGDDIPLQELSLYEEEPLHHLKPIGAEKFPILYEKRKECHTMSAMDAILTEDPYPIKAMILAAGNPLLSNPNSHKVKKAFQALELLVVRDLFMTETAEQAHYFLPAASFLERSELHVNEAYNIINVTEKVIHHRNCMDEYSFWHSLAERLGAGEYFPWGSETDLNRWRLKDTGITLEEVSSHSRGFVFKQKCYRKWLETPFNTESGKIELASAYLQRRGFRRLPEYQRPAYLSREDADFPLVMISGSKRKLYNHSRYHNIESFKKRDPRPVVGIHRQDAEQFFILPNEMVRVSSRFGSILLQAEVLEHDEILPGFILVPDGWKDSNVNLLTSDEVFDPISGFPALKSEPVKVEKI
jgi:anaerobic selenocysteine-containing dehydrogenase